MIRYFLLIINISYSFAQVRVGDWDALTSPLKVREVITLDHSIYAATEGGIFKIENDSYKTYTTIDGLIGVDISSITKDNNNIWIGGSSPYGFIQIYDPINQRSINSFDFGLTSILDIQIVDSIAWVLFQDGQDYGIMKFIFDNEWEYRDSYRNFPAESGSIHCFIATDSLIIVGMDSGLYSGQIDDNLKDPNNWIQIIPEINQSITSMDYNGIFLLATSSSQLFTYSLSTEVLNMIEFSYPLSDLDNIFISGNSYWFTDGKKLYRKEDSIDSLIEDRYELNKINETLDQVIVGLDTGLLFVDKNNGTVSRFLPNAQVTNKFSAITVLNDGRLVGGSSKGISIYSDKGWRNILEINSSVTSQFENQYNYNSFIADTVAFDFGEYISDLEEGPDGLLYCAIRGSRVYLGNPPRVSGGIIVIDVDDPTNISVIDTTYLSYHTSSNNSNPYQICLDIEFDREGNMWVANPYCINGNNPIHIRSANGEWKHYGSNETSTRISQSPISITSDTWDRVWYSAFQAEEANLGLYPNGGIFMLTYEGKPYDPINFSWKIIQNEGTVWSLGMGSNERLYYLTPSGLNYFDISNSASPIIRENAYPYYPNISFGYGAGIKIDSHGNIWTYSPSQGLHILLENTTYWPDINGLRSYNSQLLSDEITDIAFDEKRNLAYISTSKGVNVLRIPFGNYKSDYSKIKVFPSPFFIPSVKPLIIDGLLYNSSMMVMTLDGKVIRHIMAQGISIDGDQLSWDGRDNEGDYVSSGVYLLAIYNNEGSETIEKITVIKN